MFDKLQVGIRGKRSVQVVEENTAAYWGSGDVYVFSTPHMVGLMESAAVAAVDHLLPDGYRSVGTMVTIKHLASTPMGNQVDAYATLSEVDGRRLVFDLVAYSDGLKIGQGTHVRIAVQLDRFMAKSNARRQSPQP